VEGLLGRTDGPNVLVKGRIILSSPAIELQLLDVYESMHRDTTMKITNKMHYID